MWGITREKKMKNSDSRFRTFFTVALMATALSLSSCASPKDGVIYEGGVEIYDPLEETNRASFKFNDALDQAIAEPIARGYRAITPEIVRNSVSNFLGNLRSPINLGNQVLQGDIRGAATDLSRFMINTVFGIGGLFDVAKEIGLEHEQEDFGQTLAVWGVDNGAYMVLPFFGPSTFRDTTGLIADSLADPLRLYLFNIEEEGWYYARTAANAVAKREELLDALENLRRNSFDYYAALRSAYLQKRQSLINDENPDEYGAPSIPDYDYDDDF